MAPAFTPLGAGAQQPSAPKRAAAGQQANPATTETPKSEEEQENEFLNAPVVYRIAHAAGISEPTARDIFLFLNFVIIFLAIAIPLGRTMPRIFRKRGQTLRHSLELARKASEEAGQRMSAVEAKLAGLDREIAAFRAQVEEESLADEKRIKEVLKEESERIIAQAEQEIAAAAAHAKRLLRGFAADLAVDQAATQIKLTPDADRALIGDFIGQVHSEAASAAAPANGGRK